MKKIMVVGGGTAGLSAAQAARETDAQVRVRLVCGEKRLPYYRTRICELLAGLDAEKLTVRNYQWFTDNSIEVINGRVTSVDMEENIAYFEDGSFLHYDKLVLATGANGNLPDMKGDAAKRSMALRFLPDIERLKQTAGPIAVVGGGLLGLEAAWQLSRTGRPVVIIERGERLLGRQLDEEAARFFLSITENAGVRVALNGKVGSYEDNRLLLTDGRFFEAAMLVFAAGIIPKTKLAKAMGLTLARAVVVDEYMRSSHPDVYACGDCAEYQGQVAGLWTAAMAQGMIAGRNAAGLQEAYVPEEPPYMMNAMGSKLWSAGKASEDSLCMKSSSAGVFTKLFFDQSATLIGATLIGDISKALPLKKALAAGMSKEEARQNLL